ncbi:uncharacterized protein LOC119110067 [Pollicipes pollicipes]|uniref:uncharacterized protein LOC119110067 n=1 Tax=Pollicipes pollicipes TaxID=41117 RepID=UPI001884AA9D|nr:uncharacterized protein LOC119110067 [Pollicipes pollicipes]
MSKHRSNAGGVQNPSCFNCYALLGTRSGMLKWVRLVCVLALVVALSFIAWSWFTSMSIKRQGYALPLHALKTQFQQKELDPGSSSALVPVKKACAHLDSIRAGSEGTTLAGYELRAAFLLVRHGDRGPLLHVRNLTDLDCALRGPYARLVAGPLALYFTPLERTFQSGAALLYGLAGEAALSASTAYRVTRDVHLCPADAPALVVFAAHDLTLSAALLSLDVRAMAVHQQPPYAARLAIEVYAPSAEHTQKGLQFRMVYNGVDLTPLLPMCNRMAEFRYGLCGLAALMNFTGPGYMAPFDGRSYEEACDDPSN